MNENMKKKKRSPEKIKIKNIARDLTTKQFFEKKDMARPGN